MSRYYRGTNFRKYDPSRRRVTVLYVYYDPDTGMDYARILRGKETDPIDLFEVIRDLDAPITSHRHANNMARKWHCDRVEVATTLPQ